MTVRQAISDGRSVDGARILDGKRDRFGLVAVDLAPCASRRRWKRSIWSSDTERLVGPSMEIWLSSNSTIRRPSLRCPASEIASWLMPSIRQPSPAMHVGVVIDDLIAITLVEQPLGERHADGVAKPLPQRPGGGLDAGRMAIFGMAGRACEPSWRKRFSSSMSMPGHAGEVEQRIEQHRAVAGREHEAVAVGPIRVRGVEFQEAGEQHGGHIGHAHGHAGMA